MAWAGDIYRYVDEDGKVVFSDQPQPGAEAVRVERTNTYQALPAEPPPASETPAEEAEGYAAISILAPENDSAFWDASGVVPVTVQVVPDLAPGDRLELLMDGNSVAEPSRVTRFSVREVERGTHTLVAQVIDAEGKVLARSDTTTFTRHQPTELRPSLRR